MNQAIEEEKKEQYERGQRIKKIREQELKNMKKLEQGMDAVQLELKKSQQSQKIQQAYDFNADQSGNILNIQE